MRLQQHLHLNEMATTVSIQEALEYAYNKCKPYLKEVVKKGALVRWMYSGRTHNANSFERKMQVKRMPLDTPPEIHSMLNRLYKKKFGWEARSKSIFCTGDMSQSFQYGKPFLIFPTGNFKYLWHQKTKDLWNHIKYNIAAKIDTTSIDGADMLEDLLTKFVKEYKNNGLLRAIKSGNEIMVHTKEYGAFDVQIYENSFSKFFGHYGVVEPTTERIKNLWETEGLLQSDGYTYNGIRLIK